MANRNDLFQEIDNLKLKGIDNPDGFIRNKFLNKISTHTGRNVIAYYSGWLQIGNFDDRACLNDDDINAFMLCFDGMDLTLGLDIILHTPGGDLAVVESIVEYLFSSFGINIRAVVPQLALSAGTLLAFSCNSIFMGKQSSLGPIDPQLSGAACHAVLYEFEMAKADILVNPHAVPLWQSIISKYHPTFLVSCKESIVWAEELVNEWLLRNMFFSEVSKVDNVIREFSEHKLNRSHNRHISRRNCKEAGLTIYDLESDATFQDLVLSLHHVYMYSFTNSYANKIVENQLGNSYVDNAPED